MKIIIVPNEPNPNMTGRHYGIAKTLARHGHEVHTLMWDLPHQMNRKYLPRHLFTSLRTETYTYEDLMLHKIARLPLFWPVVNGWLFHRQITKLYKSLGADIIFAQSYTNETSIPANLPFIYDLADDYAAPAQVYGSRVYQLAFKLLGVRKTMNSQCRNALAVTAVSDVLTNFAKPYNKHVTKLPNGVEVDIIQKVIRKKPAAKVNPHSLIYVSGFGVWSQPTKVMQAVVDLHEYFPDISLTLVGEGSEVTNIKQFIIDNDASSYITYQGFVHDRAEVFKLINQHAIGLNISEKNVWRDAAHPMKVIEYSALGKKVVSTNLVGVEALNLPNVFMFANDASGESLRNAIIKALNAPAKLYGDVSQQILKDYDWDTIITKLTDIITAAKTSPANMQVIHVTPSYPPNLGGLEKVVQVLATTQAKAGLDVSVVTAATGSKPTIPDEVAVLRLPSFVLANTTVIPALLPHLLRIPKRSMVHLHVTQALTPELIWLASKLRRFRYIAHIHLDVAPSGMAGFLLKIYKPIFLRRVLHGARYVVVFTNDQKADIMRRYGLPASKVVVVPNGAEDAYFYNKPRTLHKVPRLLFVGRLGYQKNLQQLLHALDGISHELETTLVGDGEQAATLQALSQKLKLKNITFAGRAEGEKLLEYYKQADVFVLPSEREGMPLVLLEAMAMGLPIVATDVVGSRDVVVNDRNGLLVPYGDVEALRSALKRITTGAALYKRLHNNGLIMADNYSWEKVASRFELLYRTAL